MTLNSTAIVCTRQPLRVQHHATFIVDLESLKSREDIKCDDCGSWRSNSNTKYQFTKKYNAWFQIEKDESQKEGESLTLKRDYFVLRGDTDFRRRIDTIICKLK